LSPAKLSCTLQEDFVRTELETGYRMLTQAAAQQDLHQDEAVTQSISLARLALSGAERHLAAVNLAAAETEGLYQDLGELRRRIDAFLGSAKSRRSRE